jgi:hypothetical protein
MALFRFPTVEIDIDPTQKIAIRDANTGKFYYITVQALFDAVATGGLPSINDDGSTVDIDADVDIVGDLSAVAGLFSGALSGDTLKIASHPPASAAAAGTAGTIAWDAGFLYVCTATDTWKRVAIATW